MDLEQLKEKIPEIFERVKRDVKTVIGRSRGGLSLGLVAMGINRKTNIGGMYFDNGTLLILNTDPIEIMCEELSDEIVLAYIYYILMQLYVYSLGFHGENLCKNMLLKVLNAVFKDNPDHPAIIFATKGVESFLPDLKLRGGGFGSGFNPELEGKIERLKGFDKDSYSYYG